MNSSSRTLLSLKNQNDTNNGLRKKKKEILDIVYTELRKIDALNKKITSKLEMKYKYFKKVQKFDKTYQTMDTLIDTLILQKQDLEDNLGDFLKDNKDYINHVKSRINIIRPNSEPLSYGTPESFGGKVKRAKKRLPDGETYITYDDDNNASPSIVEWLKSSPNSPQYVHGNIDTGIPEEMKELGYQPHLIQHKKPIMPVEEIDIESGGPIGRSYRYENKIDYQPLPSPPKDIETGLLHPPIDYGDIETGLYHHNPRRVILQNLNKPKKKSTKKLKIKVPKNKKKTLSNK
jgi:hypothetical protein